MLTLLEKQIRVGRIVTTSSKDARAIEDPVRAKILEKLYHKTLSAKQIANHLKKTGYKKALTTVRHHIDILKSTGLIEIAKIEETRGGITKYYGTSTKFLDFNVPDDFELKYSSTIKNTSKKLEDILKILAPKTTLKTKKKKFEHAYSQYLMMEIMNRAITNVIENSSLNKKKKSSFN